MAPTPWVASNRLLAFLAREEALVTVAFKDRDHWAIGYSHHGEEVEEGLTWTPERALLQLVSDCKSIGIVLARCCTAELTQNQKEALMSLAYQRGSHEIGTSDLLFWVNQRRLDKAIPLFLSYEHPDRRQREQKLFVSGDYGPLGHMWQFDSDPHAPGAQRRLVNFPLDLRGEAPQGA